MEVHMLSDMEVDKMADKLGDIVIDMVADKKIGRHDNTTLWIFPIVVFSSVL